MLVPTLKLTRPSSETYRHIQGYKHMHTGLRNKPFKAIMGLHYNSNRKQPITEDNCHINVNKLESYTYAFCRALD